MYRQRRQQIADKEDGSQTQIVPPSVHKKPLLDVIQGQLGLADPTRIDLLTAKSNYEWVAEGRHTEIGLHFPDTTVASITSKRTIHSAVEQGRRDRLI